MTAPRKKTNIPRISLICIRPVTVLTEWVHFNFGRLNAIDTKGMMANAYQ
jgi:hypothetical protein